MQDVRDALEDFIQDINRRRELRMQEEAGGRNGTALSYRQTGKDKFFPDVCPYCAGTGWESYEKRDEDGVYEYYKPCRCKLFEKHVANVRLKFLNIPDGYRHCRLKDFRQSVYRTEQGRKTAKQVMLAVKFWLENFGQMQESGKGLYMFSRAKGSGKTLMAAAIANEMRLGYDIQVKYATSVQVVNEIKASWDDRDGGEHKLLDALSATEVLVLDDFGVEQESREKGWINERFFHIINQRYMERKITIFTSNRSIDALQYDERITNRIKEITFQVPFPEESVREAIAEYNQMELMDGMRRLTK